MKGSRAIWILFFLSSLVCKAHNIKILKSQSSDQDTVGIDTAFNNESFISDADNFIEGYLGYSRSTNTLDQTTSENKSVGAQLLSPQFWSFSLFTSQYENVSQELKTRSLGLELGKKKFYGAESTTFKPNYGLKIRAERINLNQSRTFTRRKFEFALEQSSIGLLTSLFPYHWFEISGSYYRYRYSEDVSTIAARLQSSTGIATLFSNIKNTITSLSESSRALSLRFLPYSWIDTTFTRYFSEDLVSDSQYHVDSIDVGIYYFPRVYFFITSGQQFSSIDSTKTNFSEFLVQFNF